MFDGAHCLEAVQCRFGCSQRSEVLPVPEKVLHGSMVAFDQIVPPFSVDMRYAVEMRIVSMTDLLDSTPICLRLVCGDGHRAVRADTFNRSI